MVNGAQSRRISCKFGRADIRHANRYIRKSSGTTGESKIASSFTPRVEARRHAGLAFRTYCRSHIYGHLYSNTIICIFIHFQGPSSTCWYAGYAMESTCHTGFECVYDSVSDLGWRVSLSNHRIIPVINDVLERYNDTAKCAVVEDCVDCYQWEWVD